MNRKLEEKKKKKALKRRVGILTSADYQKRQDHIQAPFGKAFKRGFQPPKEEARVNKKVNARREAAY